MSPFCLILLFGFAFGADFEYGCSNPYVKEAGPLVKTSLGSLVGQKLNVLGSDVAAFLGIPYAQPPVNEKRFLGPSLHDGWEGIFDATSKPPPCMQYSSRNYSWNPISPPSEDCLYLNIWTPAKCCCSLSERLPVLVWIYGGGFYAGSTDMDIYDGSVIAAHNKAIVVSINYRVGIFGFLNSGSEEAPGNVGLLDQNLALKWIKSNVACFGGNPDKITIMGESAGAWSVSLHMVSPMSRNLFNSAVMQSGAAYHPQLVDEPGTAFYKANIYAKAIGCMPDDSSSIHTNPEVLKCLKGKSSQELAKVEDAFTSVTPQYFMPTSGGEFLPIHPMKAVNEGYLAPVDVLIGSNQNEATIFLNYMIPDIFRQDTEPQLNLESAKAVLTGLFKLVPKPNSTEIYGHYFQNATSMDSSKIVEIISNAFADYIFNCPSFFFAEKVKNAYFYWFTHRSAKEKIGKWIGVPHFYEVPYLFGAPLEGTSYTAEDRDFSSDLIKKWTEFANGGHPLGKKNPEDWPLFTAEDPVVYELNPERTSTIPYPRKEACEFWRPYIAAKDC